MRIHTTYVDPSTGSLVVETVLGVLMVPGSIPGVVSDFYKETRLRHGTLANSVTSVRLCKAQGARFKGLNTSLELQLYLSFFHMLRCNNVAQSKYTFKVTQTLVVYTLQRQHCCNKNPRKILH